MPHPRPRKNRKTPSYLLLSLKDPPACYSPWTPLSSHQWDNFSPPQWYTLSTPLTRECGGTILGRCTGSKGRGLSPRVRGNQVTVTMPSASVRSIPASAGEPDWQSRPLRGTSVYPRECGGTETAKEGTVAMWGLSPRVRGNPWHSDWWVIFTGSIPASAGEPP